MNVNVWSALGADRQRRATGEERLRGKRKRRKIKLQRGGAKADGEGTEEPNGSSGQAKGEMPRERNPGKVKKKEVRLRTS